MVGGGKRDGIGKGEWVKMMMSGSCHEEWRCEDGLVVCSDCEGSSSDIVANEYDAMLFDDYAKRSSVKSTTSSLTHTPLSFNPSSISYPQRCHERSEGK